MIDGLYPVTSGKVVIKKRDDYYLVKDVKTGTQGRANEDLRDLLVLCDGTRTVKEVTFELSKGFEESEKGVKKKVVKSIEFLKDLSFLDLVETKTCTPLVIRDSDMEWPLDMAYLEVTNRCNLRCAHCYKRAGDPLPEELSTKEWFKIIDDLKNLGVLTLALTGGEPLVRSDIFEIIEYAGESTVSVNLFTNGTLLTEKMVEKLKALDLEKVIVSIDGATAKTHEKLRGENTFEKTVKGLTLLMENGLRVRTNSVIYTGNIQELEKLISFLLEMGVKEMIFDRLMEIGRGKGNEGLVPPLEMGAVVAEQCKKFEKESAERIELKFTSTSMEADQVHSFCGVGTSMVTVKANGDVVLCPVMSGPEAAAGNVKERSVRELWLKSEVFHPFRDCTLDDSLCGTCPRKEECRGGCKARALQYYGKVCMPDPWMCATRGREWPPS